MTTAMDLAWWHGVSGPGFAAGSLVIEDDTLDVDGGSSVNLRVKLSTRPRSDVVVTPTTASGLITLGPPLIFDPSNHDVFQDLSVTASGNRQEIALLNSWFIDGAPRFLPPNNSRPAIIDALKDNSSNNRFFGVVILFPNGDISLHITLNQTVATEAPGEKLSSTFESSGSIEIIHQGTSVLVDIGGLDTTEPYVYSVNNADIASLSSALSGASDRASTLILSDYSPGTAQIALAASGPPEFDGKTASASVMVD